MIEIRIRLNDRDTLEEYHDVADEIIIDDFWNDPEAWLAVSDIKVIREVKPCQKN